MKVIVSRVCGQTNENCSLEGKMKKCPYCAEEIQEEAIVCRFCGRELIAKDKYPTSINIATEGEVEPSSGAKALAGISITCGIIGLIVFGIPLGIVAIACGIPALSKGATGGKAGIILGILDIVLAICILTIL